MLNFRRIINRSDESFMKFWDLYQVAFPEHEKRTINGQVALFNEPLYILDEISEEGNFIGFIAYWIYNEFIYLEHLAINPKLRNGGFGSKVLNAFFARYSEAVLILEIDLPETEIAQRRQNFYHRLGFITNSHRHLQPPYQPHHKKQVELLVMTFPQKISAKDYNLFLKYLKHERTSRF